MEIKACEQYVLAQLFNQQDDGRQQHGRSRYEVDRQEDRHGRGG